MVFEEGEESCVESTVLVARALLVVGGCFSGSLHRDRLARLVCPIRYKVLVVNRVDLSSVSPVPPLPVMLG